MTDKIIAIAAVLFFPALAKGAAKRSKFVDALGPVVFCYLFGMVLTNALSLKIDKNFGNTLSGVCMLLALPMILYSTAFMQWLRLAKKTILAFLLAVLSVMITAAIVALVYESKLPEAWKFGGMLVGVYTGGTPNMTAIGLALKVPQESFILLNAADVVMGATYFFLLLTAIPRILKLVLPPFRFTGESDEQDPAQTPAVSISTRIKNLVIPSLLTVGVVGVSAGVPYLIFGEMSEAITIISITTLSIAASFSNRIRSLPGAFEAGDYLMLMFCVAIGTVADFRAIIQSGLELFWFVALVMFGAIVLHYLLCIIFRIDRDTTIITSTAAIYGPAFIPPIAGALKNREILVSGLTTGVMGLALGNYFGLSLSYLLKLFIG